MKKKIYTYGELDNIIRSNDIIYIFHINNLNIKSWSYIENELKRYKCKSKRIKNSIITKVLEKTQYANIAQIFVGPTFIIYNNDSIANIANIMKLNDKYGDILLLGAIIENSLLDINDLIDLSKIKDKNQLYYMLIQSLTNKLYNSINILEQNVIQIQQLLDIYEKERTTE